MSAKKGKAARSKGTAGKREADYRHPEAQSPLRPDVGTQAQFKKKKPPVTYRYDSSLAPELQWDGTNPACEQGEALIRAIDDIAGNAMGHFEVLAENLGERAAEARRRDETQLAEQIENCAKLYRRLKEDHLVAIRNHKDGNNVPAWMLDTDYNGLVFHGSQVFFPRTSAWESLKKALKATREASVWDHLSGSTGAPFEPGEHETIAVKVIDDRGNELLVVKNLKDAAAAQ